MLWTAVSDSRSLLQETATEAISLNLIQILNPCCAPFSGKESWLYLAASPLKRLLCAPHAANQNPKVNYDLKKKEEEVEGEEEGLHTHMPEFLYRSTGVLALSI